MPIGGVFAFCFISACMPVSHGCVPDILDQKPDIELFIAEFEKGILDKCDGSRKSKATGDGDVEGTELLNDLKTLKDAFDNLHQFENKHSDDFVEVVKGMDLASMPTEAEFGKVSMKGMFTFVQVCMKEAKGMQAYKENKAEAADFMQTVFSEAEAFLSAPAQCESRARAAARITAMHRMGQILVDAELSAWSDIAAITQCVAGADCDFPHNLCNPHVFKVLAGVERLTIFAPVHREVAWQLFRFSETIHNIFSASLLNMVYSTWYSIYMNKNVAMHGVFEKHAKVLREKLEL